MQGRAIRHLDGMQLGPYQLDDVVGEGGTSVVYRARHTLLDRAFAIKVLRPELGSHSSLLERFLDEARVVAAIHHPGIVEVYDHVRDADGRAYLAMELLQGCTLGAQLARCETLTVTETLMLVRRIAAPLVTAHAAGIAHRDLQPDNVFLVRDPDGGPFDHVKLLGFCTAKAARSRRTMAYAAPELDQRGDLYALGCMWFEMLTGTPPYGRGGTSDVVAAHRDEAIPCLPASVDPEVARLVTRLLAKAPTDRGSASELVAEIDQLLVVPPSPQSSPPRKTMRLVIATALAMLFTWTIQ